MPLENLEDIMKEKWYEKPFSHFRKLKFRFKERRMENQFKKQRKAKGYADCDVWEIRTWFVNTAKPMLLEMAENVDNHPDELTFEEWREILKRMAYLLDIMDIWDDDILRKELGISEEADSDNVIVQLQEKQKEAKDEFFFLFNKWFYDLWY